MDGSPSEQQLQELLDRNAISDLVSRLGRWLDQKRFEDAEENAALFMPDLVVETPGGHSQGIAAAAEQARRRHREERTQHLHTNVLITLDGDQAAAEANLIVTFVPDANAPSSYYQVGTRYSFALKRTGEGWRFASIRDRLIWRSNPPQ